MSELHRLRLNKLALIAALVSLPMVLGNEGCDPPDHDTDALCSSNDNAFCPGGNVCTLEYAPVCGEDGRTYGNRCHAESEGVAIAHEGACGEITCGGLLGVECPCSMFCDYPIAAMCGAADQTGVCRTRPQACPEIYRPVCGCDGVTYGNACEARAAGMSVASEGECNPAGDTCGGLLGIQCGRGEFCDFPIETMCGSGDQMGVCRTPPEACTREYAPVCGCDGVTYGNACSAASASMSVAHVGACEKAWCGGLIGLQCPSGQFCNYPIETMCGSGDQTGECQTPPEACTLDYSPVCGCDGKTYSNACHAAGASVSVVHTGPCVRSTTD